MGDLFRWATAGPGRWWKAELRGGCHGDTAWLCVGVEGGILASGLDRGGDVDALAARVLAEAEAVRGMMG